MQHKEIKATIATKALKEETAIDETVIKIAKDEEEAAATKALEEQKAKDEEEAAAATKTLEEQKAKEEAEAKKSKNANDVVT